MTLDPFCENPSEYPTATVGRILAGYNNSATNGGPSVFFSPPAPLEDQEFVEGKKKKN